MKYNFRNIFTVPVVIKNSTLLKNAGSAVQLITDFLIYIRLNNFYAAVHFVYQDAGSQPPGIDGTHVPGIK